MGNYHCSREGQELPLSPHCWAASYGRRHHSVTSGWGTERDWGSKDRPMKSLGLVERGLAMESLWLALPQAPLVELQTQYICSKLGFLKWLALSGL